MSAFISHFYISFYRHLGPDVYFVISTDYEVSYYVTSSISLLLPLSEGQEFPQNFPFSGN
jgi:hypothetical protein